MTYDIERIVVGGGVSHAGGVFWQPIERELSRQRQASALAREVLRPDRFYHLPPDFDAGLWGAITLAEHGLLNRNSYTLKGGDRLASTPALA